MNQVRGVIYDITVLKQYVKVPTVLRADITPIELLSRVLRHYFDFRLNCPAYNVRINRYRAKLAKSSTEKLLRHTEIREDRTYRLVILTIMDLLEYIDRFVMLPGPELPDRSVINEVMDLDIGVPRDMFRHYTGKVTSRTILGKSRWHLHFDIKRDFYEDHYTNPGLLKKLATGA